jgi:hypothetical protein
MGTGAGHVGRGSDAFLVDGLDGQHQTHKLRLSLEVLADKPPSSEKALF